jgi:hypothetical protein
MKTRWSAVCIRCSDLGRQRGALTKGVGCADEAGGVGWVVAVEDGDDDVERRRTHRRTFWGAGRKKESAGAGRGVGPYLAQKPLGLGEAEDGGDTQGPLSQSHR